MKRFSAVYLAAAVACAAIWGMRALAQQFPANDPRKSDDRDRGVISDNFDPNIGRDKTDRRTLGDKANPDSRLVIDFEKPADAVAAGGVSGDPRAVSADRAGAPSLEVLKARYQEAEGRLTEVADTIAQALGTANGMSADERDKLSDRLQAAVSALFEARQAMQQAELAHLERRVAKTKRALALREQAKQVIVEERTGTLMDEIESGAWQRRAGPGMGPGMGGPGMGPGGMGGSGMGPGGMGGAGMGPGGMPPSGRMGGGMGAGATHWDMRDPVNRWDVPRAAHADYDAATKERLQELEVKEAQTRLDEARKAYDRSMKMQHAIPEVEIDRFASELKLAELGLERAQIQYDAFRQQSLGPTSGDLLNKSESDRPSSASIAPELEERLLMLDVEEAKLALETAQSARGQIMNEKGIGLPTEHEAAAARARIHLERAETKLELHKRQHPTSPAGAADDGRQ
ncbi:MAG TPA: hypothetical protein VGX76_05380 [Pirellulales bacterium]|jgi:hypothetical protein|nr:hypothetical protein [Pirellulales bacterium]